MSEPIDVLARARQNAARRTNLPQLVAERAAETPDEVFAWVEDEEFTYGAVYARCLEWAGVFQSLGVKAGDHVVNLTDNRFDGYAQWIGLSLLGAVEVPINTAFRGPILAHAINMSDAKLAVLSPAYLKNLRELQSSTPAFERIIVLGAAPFDSSGLATITEREAFAGGALDKTTLIDPQPHDTACIILTSGTTGPSKAVLVPWGQIIAASYPERLDQQNDDLWNMNSSSIFYAFFPSFHMAGRYAFANAYVRGARIMFRHGFSVNNFWQDVDRYGVTHAQLLSPMMAFLMSAPESEDDPKHSLIAVNGGPVGDILDRFMKRYNVRVRTGFGMTEIGGPLATSWHDPSDPPRSSGSMTIGRPGYELRLVDEHDNPVPEGECGELIVRASDPWVLNAGYYKMPKETAEAWRNGWFHTGDILRMDQKGEYHFVDRGKDYIRRRGENISSVEVETYIIVHPSVLECAAVPYPSEHGEDEVKVWIRRRPDTSLEAEELHAWLRERMPKHMVPTFIQFTEDFPRTAATQRIQKAELKRLGNDATTWRAA